MNGLLFGVSIVIAVTGVAVGVCGLVMHMLADLVGAIILDMRLMVIIFMDFLISMIMVAVITVVFVFILDRFGFCITIRTVAGRFGWNASIFFVSGKYTGCRVIIILFFIGILI
jgi:hypothetical protein